MTEEKTPRSPAMEARRLIRSRDRAVLSTCHGERGGWPHGSLVLVACAQDATPLLFISDLAEHTRNIKHDPRVSLLFDGTEDLDDPLTGARAAILGRAVLDDGEAARARFLSRHPSAAVYAGFQDFHLYRVEIEAAHVVAGFGRIDWVVGADLRATTSDALTERETDIVTHMNEDHADALQAYASGLLGISSEGWRMTGCDCEGFDMRLGGKTARVEFSAPVSNAAEARAELVRLAKQARGLPPVA